MVAVEGRGQYTSLAGFAAALFVADFAIAIAVHVIVQHAAIGRPFERGFLALSHFQLRLDAFVGLKGKAPGVAPFGRFSDRRGGGFGDQCGFDGRQTRATLYWLYAGSGLR